MNGRHCTIGLIAGALAAALGAAQATAQTTGQATGGEQCAHQGERQRKDGVLDPDHLQSGAETPEEGEPGAGICFGQRISHWLAASEKINPLYVSRANRLASSARVVKLILRSTDEGRQRKRARTNKS